MKNILTYIVFLTILIITMNCNSNKKIINKDNNNYKNKISAESKKCIAEGLKEALLFKGEKNLTNCNVTIKVNGSEDLLDPINIKEDFLKSASDEQKIWISFGSLRMLNRCDKARPIKIIEIKKREE